MKRPSLPILLALLLLLGCHAGPAPAQEQDAPADPGLSDVEKLLAGAHANRIDVILRYLQKGVDVNARGKNGYTALMVAAGRGSRDAVELLLARGADVDLANDEGWTALMEAIYREHEETAKRLLRAGADVNAREDRKGLTPLLIAARTDMPDIVAALIEKGADVNAAERERGLTPLHLALGSDELKADEIAAELLVAGADAGKPAADGFTPLMAAVDSGLRRRVSLILSEAPETDLNAAADDGRTALSLAAGYGETAMVRRLLEAGADPTAAPGRERPLAEAIRGGSRKIVQRLLEAGADPETPGADGKTPLIVAARSGHDAIVRLLLEAGADVNARDTSDGTTALMWAANNGLRSIVELLMEHGADAGLVAEDGWTAGEAARMAGHTELARLLERRS